jgi:Ca-activated chloride channel family protein
MSSFSRPEILVFIPVALGILLFVHLRSRKLAKKRIRILVSKKLMSRLISQFSEKRALLKFIFFLTSIVFCCLALSGPQWGSTQRSVTPQGIDLLIAVDLSKSMLAEDVSPNRLERVKLNISNLLDQVKGDSVGMIAFSGTAFLHCPLTLDHQAFSKTLNELEVGLIPKMGTDLGQPIDEARRSFSKDDKDKFLILISDGEDLEGRGLMQAKEAAKEGIQTHY